MSLIAIIISLILERSVESLRRFRRFEWFNAYTDHVKDFCSQRNWLGPLAVVLVMLAPVLVIVIVNAVLYEVWLGFFSLLFSTAVLYLCLGPKDLEKQVDTFLDAWTNEDEAAANQAAEEILGKKPPTELADLQRQLVEKILLEANERVLTPIFWFVVFSALGGGPLGVVLYRLACLMKQRYAEQKDEFAEATRRLHAILGWLPAHVAALIFAIAGSFVDAFSRWRESSRQWRENWQESVNGTVLAGGLGALKLNYDADQAVITADDVHDRVRSSLGLVLRALVIMLVLLVIMTLFVLVGQVG